MGSNTRTRHRRQLATGAQRITDAEGLPYESGARVMVDPDLTPGERLALLDKVRDLLGPTADFQALASVVGAPADSTVRFHEESFLGGIQVYVQSDRLEAQRRIFKADGQVVIENQYFRVHGRNDQDFNGYYTWPRFGYNRALTPGERSVLPRGLRSAETVLDVMKTARGRDYWKANGNAGEMKFDLRAGSRSRKVLAAYLKERGRDNRAESAGLQMFRRQVANSIALRVNRIETYAAGRGPQAR